MATYNRYSPEQEAFLKTNAPFMSRKELTELFNARFDTNKSELAIKSWCNARGFNSSNDGRFKDGHCSWQTGLTKEDFKSHYSEKSFDKMLHNMKESNKTHVIGDEIIRHGIPHIVISTDYNKPFHERLMVKRRYVWEKAYGQIPDDHMVIHLDGDHMNCDLSNLACIPTKYRPLLNKNHWLGNSKDVTLTAVKWCELFYATKEMKGDPE